MEKEMPKREKGSRPDYVCRASSSSDTDFMVTIGGAWRWKEGDGFVVRLHSTPFKWDGTMILARPNDEQPGDGK